MKTTRKPIATFRLLAIIVLVVNWVAGGTGIALAKKPLPDHPVDLNAASAKELEELPGIGPTTANAIIAFRMKSGRIRRVEDLLAIRGISEPKLKKIRPYVTLGVVPAATPSKKTTATSPPTKITVTPKQVSPHP